MAIITPKSGLIAESAKIIDDPRDSLKPVEDFNKPKDELADLTAWVLSRVKRWRDHRRSNYELAWDKYERLWRGLWSPEDKSRNSERSQLITPGLGEAVENIVAEVEEAVFGRGDFFDLKAELSTPEETKAITDQNKAFLKEDLGRSDFIPNIGEALINAAVYGSGIAEIHLETFIKRDISASVQAIQPGVPPEAQVIEKQVTYACLQSINPRNFLIEPTARTVDKALGVAIEEYVGSHLIKKGQDDGTYRKTELTTSTGDTQLGVDRQVENEYAFDKVHVIRYYGLVPMHLLFPKGKTAELFPTGSSDAEVPNNGDEVVVDLTKPDESGESQDQSGAKPGEKSEEPLDGDMVEAIVVLANEGVCIKAVENPFLMKDRPVVAFPWDIVPGRFWGRGVCEKGIVPQMVMDAELRARIDALAYISAPMMAMDASRLPRGFQLKVRPGKSILTNGDPNTILRPMHFGQLEQSTFNHSQQLDQMIQRATGSLDVMALAQKSGDQRPGAVSMMLSGIVKRHKRTLMGFIDRFFIPALRKIMWRNMQYYPERYTPINWNFVASSSMGILQREYETTNLVQLMNTMEPQSKEYKMLLMGVVENTGLTKRTQIMEMIKASIESAQAIEQAQAQQAQDPSLQNTQLQVAQAGAQLQLQEIQAKIAELGARTRLQDAKAANAQIEPKFRQMEIATKGIYQVQQDQQKQEFDRRMAVEDRLLKQDDIKSNERIAYMQSQAAVASERIKAHTAAGQSQASVASERIKASAQPPKAPVPVPFPVPHPVPVAHPVPIAMPYRVGPRPIVAQGAQILG